MLTINSDVTGLFSPSLFSGCDFTDMMMEEKLYFNAHVFPCKTFAFPQRKVLFLCKTLHSHLCLFIKLCVPLKKLTFVRKI